MFTCALLTRESANRVYADQAADMLLAELAAIGPTLHALPTNVARRTLGAVEYVTFEVPELDEHDRFVVSNLSNVRAVFALSDALLQPLLLEPLAFYDSDLITIQRYPGKTNEQFTHLLLNATLAASRAAHERAERGQPVRLLDPVAGRGTTLNRALMYGFDAYGVEMADADVDQYRVFLSKYLKDHRIKHQQQREEVKKGPLKGTSRFSFDIAGTQHIEVVRGDAVQADALLPGRKFDLIVGDLPYGVQHRAAATKQTRRSPIDFLDEALDSWRPLLHARGALGLSWNLRTMKRKNIRERLAEHGFEPVEHAVDFRHDVDRSITRDLIVARPSR